MLRNKIVLLNKITFPNLWGRHYSKAHMSGYTNISGVSHECSDIIDNLGDYLGNIIVPYMLSLKNIHGGGHK